MAEVYGMTDSTVPLRQSGFDMSYSKMFTAQFGKLYPCYLQDCVPGDVWNGGNEVILRAQPMVAPVLDSADITVHYFFVPYRLLGSIVGASNPFTASITGYMNGVGYKSAKQTAPYDLPRANYVRYKKDGEIKYTSPFYHGLPDWFGDSTEGEDYSDDNPFIKNTLWDFFGFPTIDLDGVESFDNTGKVNCPAPLMLPWYAYNMVCNEYYRDENVMNPVLRNNNDILLRCEEKDYFTTSLPFQQKGTAPVINLQGVSPLVSPLSGDSSGPTMTTLYSLYVMLGGDKDSSNATFKDFTDLMSSKYPEFVDSENLSWMTSVDADQNIYAKSNPSDLTPLNTISGASYIRGSSLQFDINSLRTAMAIQAWMERNASCGNRYNEYLMAHFKTNAGDDRLNRPEYIGGSKQPLVISEVLNTANSKVGDSQFITGDMAGHGLSADGSDIGTYHVKEFGCIIGIMSIMPGSSYIAQGIDQAWTKPSRYDWYSPEFASLGNAPIYNGNFVDARYNGFVVSGDNDPDKVFGYQGAWDYMRSRRNEITGNMRDTFDYWHFGRKFSSVPQLNGSFLTCKNSEHNRVFAVQDEDPFIVYVNNHIGMIRPLPVLATPNTFGF